jgi:N-acetylneuraminic acid mutarotase
MIKARASHTATLLPDGRVLVAGGTNSSIDAMFFSELYDPVSGSWTVTGDMVMPAAPGRTSTLLRDGRVLVVGGLITTRIMLGASPELYDPASGSWTVAADMLVPSSFGHTATLLPDGRVLVAGGVSGVGATSLASAALYDPGNETR